MNLLPLRLAIAELRHERLFALGVMLAVCSVLTPILLLWGVKNGMINSLRERLMKDPRTRELRALESVDIPSEWITTWRNDPLTAFVVPSVRQISLYGRMRTQPGAGWIDVDEILPSAVGDPLGDVAAMDWQGGGLPVPCMISESLAESLRVSKGASVQLEETRVAGNQQQQRHEVALRVAAVIPTAFSPMSSLYLPVSAVESIEDYKDGKAVPLFGWPAVVQESLARFHGIVARPMSPAAAPQLRDQLNTEFTGAVVEIMDAEKARALIDLPLAETSPLVVVRYDSPRLDLELMQRLGKQWRGPPLAFIPFLLPLQARAKSGGDASFRDLTVRTRSGQWMAFGDLKELFSGQLPVPGPKQGLQTRLEIQGAGFVSIYELALAKPADLVLDVPPALAGLLGAGVARALSYNQFTQSASIRRQQYAGFRLYARSIDDVKPLRQLVEQKGVKVHTHEDRIAQVKSLDAALSKLFFLVAGMGVLGGLGALSASLYLSVERGKRQFCVLRVLGVSRPTIVLTILLQGCLLVAMGSAIAALLYWLGARLLGELFVDAMEPGEVLCRLGIGQVALLAVVVTCLGAVVGVLSSLRLRGLDAAAVARSE